MKIFVSRFLTPAKRHKVMFFSGGSDVVWSIVFLFAMHPTFRNRALDTIHEALTVAGGSCSYHFNVTFLLTLCTLSVQIHHGWPSKPVDNGGRDPVSFCLHTPIFLILILSQRNRCKSHPWCQWKVYRHVAVTDTLWGTCLCFLLGTTWLIEFRPQ